MIKKRRKEASIELELLQPNSIISAIAEECHESRSPIPGCPNNLVCRDVFGSPSSCQKLIEQVIACRRLTSDQIILSIISTERNSVKETGEGSCTMS